MPWPPLGAANFSAHINRKSATASNPPVVLPFRLPRRARWFAIPRSKFVPIPPQLGRLLVLLLLCDRRPTQNLRPHLGEPHAPPTAHLGRRSTQSRQIQ